MAPESTHSKRTWRDRILPALTVWLFLLSPVLAFLLRYPQGEVVSSGVPPLLPVAPIGEISPATQSFRAVRDHLSGIGVQLQTGGGSGGGVWRFVLATPQGKALFSGRFTPRRRWGRRFVWFNFPPLEDSRSRRFIFWILKEPGDGGRGLVGVGSAGNTYKGGSLILGGRESEMDLAFRTLYGGGARNRIQTPSPTPVLRPPWFAAPPVPTLAVLLLCLGLFPVVLILVDHTVAHWRPRAIDGVTAGTAVGVVIAIFALGPGSSYALEPGGPTLPSHGPGRALSLVDEFYSAETEIHLGGGLVAIIRGRDDIPLDQVLYMHPDLKGQGPPRVSYHIELPERPILRFTPWLDPKAIHEGSDGVDFQVSVSEGAGPEVLVFRAYVGPGAARKSRRVEVDLGPWAGRRITLSLRIYPGPAQNTMYDWAGWGDPVVVPRD